MDMFLVRDPDDFVCGRRIPRADPVSDDTMGEDMNVIHPAEPPRPPEPTPAPANWSYTPEPPEPPPRRKIYKKLRRVPRPTTADVAISMDTDEVPSARGEADLGVCGDPPR